MEYAANLHFLPASRCPDRPETTQARAPLDPVLTDAVLSELKEQSTAGCLLCAMDEWDGEDWD